MSEPRHIVVIGGGAAGFFGAIAAAETGAGGVRVTLCEAAPQPLAKVRISGGGRCNVTHDCSDPRRLVAHYPRGDRELLGPFTRFGPPETMAWFRGRGVALETMEDGCVFPVANDSAVVIECLLASARRAGVQLRTRCGVLAVKRGPDGFAVRLAGGETLDADRVLLATGGGKAGGGLEIARALGHAIVPPVPSLFTFHIADPRLEGIAGLVVEHAAATAPRTKLRGEGPLLVTHEGLSGPAILRLSAWGAREFADCGYRFPVRIDFAPGEGPGGVAAEFERLRATHGKKQLTTWCPLPLPLRLWERLVAAAGARPGLTWAEVTRAVHEALVRQVTAAEFAVTGKSMNKEEFVTCGGVVLGEVDFRTMESRVCPGLHLAGEVLDIDGLTGGFNFQAAWTTGWHAGQALAAG